MADGLVFAGVDEHQHPTKAVRFFEETNAMCESFFATLECELIERTSFTTRSEARLGVFDFVEGWYNPDRLHSALDYESPSDYEKEYFREQPLPMERPSPVAA
jgi:putative transposase